MIQSLYEPFKHWSDGGSIWLISDPHFEDTDTKLMNPNWIDVNEHIKIINNMVYKNDTLVCLGDCGNLERFNDIKCKNRVLIKGNHDDKGNSKYAAYFNEVYKGALFISDQILLSHEPIYGLKFCVNIHGHEHSFCTDKLYYDQFDCPHINIAADVCNFQPLNLGKLIKNGMLTNIKSIHRITIDKAINNKENKL